MNDEWLAIWKRGAELEAFTAVQLRDMLTALGWEITGRKNKAAYKQAIMHLEGLRVYKSVVADLKLVKLEGVA